MIKFLLRIWYKITCNHDFYMDKQITQIKCRKCGYKNWVLNRGNVNLYPHRKSYGIEEELQSKKLFE